MDRTRRWPKALLHGWLSGTLTFLVLLIVVGALPTGAWAAGLALYAGLVLPPAVVSYRVRGRPAGPRELPRPQRSTPPMTAEVTAQAERAITRYGELLHAHPYSPGEAAGSDELTDYSAALDAYEQAKRAAPGQVPAILAEGRAALDRLAAVPRATSGLTWSKGEGTMKLAVPRPAPGVPAVLVFETDVAQRFSVHTRSGPRGRRELLLDGVLGPTSAQVGVAPQDAESLFVEVSACGPWRLALRPISEARRLADGGLLRGHGAETVLKRGASRTVEFEHLGDAPFAVRQLTRSFRPAGLLAEGRGSARLTVSVPGRGVLRVDTTGEWRLVDPGA
ncbi:hypothetical protein [Streptomyces poriticola]|uniref:hypothetical protein n=1 Tax=Streptomyces poriticola TaxID=3120506 RepID=UPI002FCE3793